MRQLQRRELGLIIANTLFWLAAGYVLLFSDLRFINGFLIALMLGAGLIFFSLHQRKQKPLRRHTIRLASLIGGALLLVGSLLGILQRLSVGLPTSDKLAQDRIDRALAEGSQTLDLSNLDLTTLPPTLGQLTQLTFLDLHNNRLTRLPAELGGISHLTTLDLSGNRLTQLPAEIGRLSQLQTLDVSRNALSDLPPEIGQLTNLTTLNFFDNQLQALPSTIGRLADLTELSLNYNRLTQLPHEIVQLTKLKTLRLSGNPFPELPEEARQLASLYGVHVEYEVQAQPQSQVNYAVLCPGVLIFFLLLTFVLDHWLQQREAKTQIKSRQRGEVFAIPAFARGACIYAILLTGFLDLLLLASAFNGERTHVSWSAGLGVPLILVPVFIFCGYMLIHNSGLIILTPDAVIVHRLGRDKVLAYQDINRIQEWRWGLPPSLIVSGSHSTLSIPRSLENWPRFYTRIQQLATSTSVSAVFPYELQIKRSAVWSGILEILLLVVIYLGIGLVALWLPALQEQTPAPLPALVIFAITSLFFIPAIAIFIKSVVKPDQPSGLVLSAETIRFHYPAGHWQAWQATELRTVEQRPVSIPLSVINLPVRIWETATTYRLYLTFTSERQIVIDRERARQFGLTLEQLETVLRQLYPNPFRRTA